MIPLFLPSRVLSRHPVDTVPTPGMRVWVGHEMDGQHTGVNSLPGR
ncbi:MAG: hypothetical protein FJ090_16045 [Deltaproteobacteria bacterium]|nr:hypothetical protein [Deltaproteobacteria bacterium]